MAPRRDTRTPSWSEVAADAERLVVGRPKPEDVEAGAAVRAIVAGDQPSVRVLGRE